MKLNPVDIAIVDIKMPLMDGLRFVENIGSKVKKIKIIILSAYGYFEYAQKALALGVFDYILKPVDEETIESILEKAEKSLQEDRIRERQRELIEKRLDSTLPVYIEHQLNKWVNGVLPISQMEDIAALFPHGGSGLVALVKLDYSRAVAGRYSLNEMAEVCANIKDWITEILKNMGYVISFNLEGMEDVTAFVINSSEDFATIHDVETFSKLEEVIGDIKATYDIDVTIAFGSGCRDIYNDIKYSFKQALDAAEYDFFIGKGKVISYDRYGDFLQASEINLYQREDIMLEVLRKKDIKAVEDIIDDLFFDMIMDGYPRPRWCVDAVTRFAMNVAYKLKELTVKNSYLQFVEDMSKRLKECKAYGDLRENIKMFMNYIIDELCNEENYDKDELIIQKCLDYIDDHYMDDISLSSVARIFYFNPNYFSSFFRAHTGQTFSQYLLKLRLQKAHELLEKTDYKVYDIAAKVGYKDVKYFNRVFKSEYNMTPEEFRRLIASTKRRDG